MRRSIVRSGWRKSPNRGCGAGGVLLPTARRAEVLAAGSSARTAGGKQETPDVETALPDSVDWSDPGGRVAGHPADPASVSHQATAVDLRWSWHRDVQQCRSPLCRRATTAIQEASIDSRAERKLQSRCEESTKGRGDR